MSVIPFVSKSVSDLLVVNDGHHRKNFEPPSVRSSLPCQTGQRGASLPRVPPRMGSPGCLVRGSSCSWPKTAAMVTIGDDFSFCFFHARDIVGFCGPSTHACRRSIFCFFSWTTSSRFRSHSMFCARTGDLSLVSGRSLSSVPHGRTTQSS